MTSVGAPKYGLCTSVRNLDELGSGFPLYYYLKSFTMLIYMIMFIVVGIFCTISNLAANKGEQWRPGQSVSWIVRTSLGNHGIDSSENYR